MALIKCPECGREISDRAESCQNCGFPLSEIKTDTSIHFYWVGRPGDSLRKTEVYIDGNPYLIMKCGDKKTVSVDGLSHTVDLYQGKHHLLSETVTIDEKPNYYIFAYKEVMGLYHAKIVRKAATYDDFFRDPKKPEFVPHCPTCGSPRVRRVSLSSRVISVSLVGYASKSAGKSFKCANCGYMW